MAGADMEAGDDLSECGRAAKKPPRRGWRLAAARRVSNPTPANAIIPPRAGNRKPDPTMAPRLSRSIAAAFAASALCACDYKPRMGVFEFVPSDNPPRPNPYRIPVVDPAGGVTGTTRLPVSPDPFRVR